MLFEQEHVSTPLSNEIATYLEIGAGRPVHRATVAPPERILEHREIIISQIVDEFVEAGELFVPSACSTHAGLTFLGVPLVQTLLLIFQIFRRLLEFLLSRLLSLSASHSWVLPHCWGHPALDEHFQPEAT